MRAILLLLLLALDPAFVKATVESIGATISKEYFDPKSAPMSTRACADRWPPAATPARPTIRRSPR